MQIDSFVPYRIRLALLVALSGRVRMIFDPEIALEIRLWLVFVSAS